MEPLQAFLMVDSLLLVERQRRGLPARTRPLRRRSAPGGPASPASSPSPMPTNTDR